MDIENILVPVALQGDGEMAFDFASRIATPLNARLTMLHVVNEDDLPDREGEMSGSDAMRDAEEKARSVLEEMAGKHPGARATVNVVTSDDDPARHIVQAVESGPVDMVVMGTQRKSAVLRAVLGSTADEVARNSTVPVILLNPVEPPSPPGSEIPDGIIVPLDGKSESEHVVPMARFLAQTFQAKLIFVHAYSRDTSSIEAPEGDSGAGEVPDPDVDEMEKYLERFVSQATAEGVDARAEVRRSEPLTDIIEDIGASVTNPLVVVASPGRSGLLRMLIGSVPDELNRLTSVPVMVVPQEN